MKSMRRGWLIFVAVILSSSGSAPAFGQSDAEVSHLLQSIGPDSGNLEHVSEELARIGKPAVPALLGALSHRDAIVRVAASSAFSEMGPVDGRILPALVAAMGRLPAPTDGDIPFITQESSALISAIKSMGRDAMALLVATLDHERPFTRATAALALATLAGYPDIQRAGSGRPDRRPSYPLAREAIARLIQCLDDDDGAVRFGAVAALLTIEPGNEQAEAVIDALVARFSDPIENVVDMSVEGITRFGPKSAVAVRPLMEVFRAKGPSIGVAAEALGALGPIAEPAVPMLIEASRDEEPAVRRQAIHALGLIGPQVQGVELALQAAMADIDYYVRSETSEALARIGQREVPDLIKAMGSPNCLIRSSAADALRRIGPEASSAAPALVSCLRDDDEVMPDEMGLPLITLALQAIGAPAVPSLSEALGHEDRRIRLRAVEVLARIGPPGFSAADRLSDLAARDPDPEVRRYAAFASAALRPNSPQNVAFLAEVYGAELREADTRFHQMVRVNAGSLGASGTKEALTALIEILKRLDVNDRSGHHTVEWAFLHAGPRAIPILIDGLGRGELHDSLVVIFQGIGPPSVPSLLVALFSDAAARREGARKCLRAIMNYGAAYRYGSSLLRPVASGGDGPPLILRPIR